MYFDTGLEQAGFPLHGMPITVGAHRRQPLSLSRSRTGGTCERTSRPPLWPARPATDPRMYARLMTESTRTLLRDALALPEGERADLVAELLVSLEPATPDDPAVVQASWAREIECRAHRVLAGESSGQDWAQVRERVAGALTEE